jgi:hypothetical protein
MDNPNNPPCLWCAHPFGPRRGGSPQRFCCAAHRIAFWSALRRWAERAVARGALTVDHIRSGDPAACTLLPGAISPEPISAPEKRAPVSPAASPEETQNLLDDFLIATLE